MARETHDLCVAAMRPYVKLHWPLVVTVVDLGPDSFRRR